MNKRALSIYLIGLTMNCFAQNQTTPAAPQQEEKLTLLVGTYTNGSSKGIYTFRFDQQTGLASPLSHTPSTNPSFLIPSIDKKMVYAVNETENKQSAVSAFAFDKESGMLTLLNSQETMGSAPCHLATDGKKVVTANYGGGSITVFPIHDDGSLLPASDLIKFSGSGPIPKRQDSPHLHCILFSPDGKHLFANDLGTDQIHKFDLNSSAKAQQAFLSEGTPASVKLSPGSGPRHMVFSANGKLAYLINEISGTVVVFKYTNGELLPIQSIAADTLNAQGSADIHISPDGKFLYASNRLKGDGLAIFKISPTHGKLTRVGYQQTGIHPRNFIISPDGTLLLVACRDANTIQVFQRNTQNGLLTPTHNDIPIDKPVCLQWIQ